MSSFKKEHYERIAKTISQLGENPSKQDVKIAFNNMLSTDSLSFISHMFMEKCEKN
jgi:hypothetical protein